MDGYNAMLRILRENPAYMPLVKRCIEAHRTEMQKPCSLGFEWSDVGIQPVRLMRLATDYGILTVSYKSNSATCYMVKGLDGVVKALEEIEADRIATPAKKGAALRVWLSAATLRRLKDYIENDLPDEWDAENLVIERALNMFLDSTLSRSGSGEKAIAAHPPAENLRSPASGVSVP